DCGEDVARAKAALVRHKWGSKDGKGVGTTEVELDVKKAKHRLEEAEAKLEVTRRWQRELPKSVHEYQGPAHQLTGFLEADLKQILAMLDRMATSLEAYVALTAPPGGAPPPPPVPTEPETAAAPGSEPCT